MFWRELLGDRLTHPDGTGGEILRIPGLTLLAISKAYQRGYGAAGPVIIGATGWWGA